MSILAVAALGGCRPAREGSAAEREPPMAHAPRPTQAPPGNDADADRVFPMNGGFWTRRREADGAPTVPSDKLLSLPYVAGSHAPDPERGVTVYVAGRARDGLNLYTSAHAAEAILMDMNGTTVHRWAYDRDSAWPELADYDTNPASRYFRRVRPMPDGGLLAIYDYTGIVRLDAASHLVWAYQGWNHHDMDVDETGRVFVLGSESKVVPEFRDEPILADNVTVLSDDGKFLDKLEIALCLTRSSYPGLLRTAREIPSTDVFHTNTIQILDGKNADRFPAFKKGNLLISLRSLNTIGIIDPAERRLVWAAWGPWKMQHEPVLMPDGDMLLFDNQPVDEDEPSASGASRVLEFDPIDKKLLWKYEGDADDPFYSSMFGTASRLDNGNTLITESTYGRAFEVTPDKRIVWEFKNPNLTGEHDEFVAIIPEMIRLDASFWPPLVATASDPP